MESKELVLKICDLNPHVVCSLCAGYFVDAATITECLHTFCKSCIVKYFQTSKHCPMCNLKIHETQPLLNLRLDRTMQDIVAKVVPGILEAEETRRREFYKSRGMSTDKVLTQDENQNDNLTMEKKVRRDYSECKNMYREDELVSLCVERHSLPDVPEDTEHNRHTKTTLSKKYLRCSARMMVIHLQKFLYRKLNIGDNQLVEILCNEHVIHPGRTMKFIWLSEWLNREPPMVLHYRIRGMPE